VTVAAPSAEVKSLGVPSPKCCVKFAGGVFFFDPDLDPLRLRYAKASDDRGPHISICKLQPQMMNRDTALREYIA
jgi:hypothetical protein